MGNKILNISLVTKMLKKWGLYAYSVQNWVYIKEMSTKLDVCTFRKIYLEKYNEIWEKLSNIIKIIKKKLNSEPVHNEKISKSWENKSTQKKVFNLILINSVYREDENYYPKVFLEKCNFNDSDVDSDEEYFEYSDNSYEKTPRKKNSNEGN